VIRIPESDAAERVFLALAFPEGFTPSRFRMVACCIGVPVSEV
jgi:hypothetical protein